MRSIVVLALVIALSGCAAIFGSKQKNFDLRSTPTGAEVFLDGARVGTTPFKINLSNQKEHTFVFRQAGYKDVTCQLAKGTGGGWVVADILLGLVPVIIDAATGAWSQTQGDSCMASMEPDQLAATSPADAPRATPTDAARTIPPPAAPTERYQRPVAGFDRMPEGINYIGDNRTMRVYSVGCAAAQHIPADSQYFYMTQDGAIADGFKPSADC